jgi:hypothetical protein
MDNGDEILLLIKHIYNMIKDFYFSLAYNGMLEEIDIREGVNESEIDSLIDMLKTNGLLVSDHRTNGDVYIENGNVIVTYQYFTAPEDGSFEDMELKFTI